MTSPRDLPLKNVALKNKHSAGFTIIELLVTLSIVVLATGLVMIRYVSFNSSVLLNSLAYQVAFDLRETQSLAISVRGSNAEFREEYGMYFDINTPNQYILFQDTNQTVTRHGYIAYDSDENEMIGSPIIIDPRFTIADICGTSLGGARSCLSQTGGQYPQFISVAFARPDFDAIMFGDGIGVLSSAEIIIGTGDDSSDITRTVFVGNGGQITVK